METLRDLDLVRAVALTPTIRAMPKDMPDDGEHDPDMMTLGRLVVRFSPFNVWYEVSSWWEGDFLERTVRGAFAKTMAESKANIRCLYDHGYDFQIGNKVLCPTDVLREDADAAVLEGDLFNTSYNRDLLPGLQASCYGSSFRFRVIKEEWNDEPGVSDHNPKGLPERTILEVRLFEAGPVTFPASPTATAAVRSMTDSYYERLRSREPQAYDALYERAAQIRTPRRLAAAEGTAAPHVGAAPQQTDEPASRHSDGYGPRRRRELIYLTQKGCAA